MEGFYPLFKHVETSPLNSPPVSGRSSPCWVSGSERAKTYGSRVHDIFQLFVDSRLCQWLWTLWWASMPPLDGRARQLSRKGWRNGREHGSQVIEKTSSLISVFPEKASSRESLFLMVSLSHNALTVGFRFVAAANPIRALKPTIIENEPTLSENSPTTSG
jgi:hypothetical protein